MFAVKDGRREELYNCLLEKIKELGKKPSFTEVKLDEKMPDPNEYAYHYGSFSQAVEEAWKGYNRRDRHSIKIKKPVKLGKPG